MILRLAKLLTKFNSINNYRIYDIIILDETEEKVFLPKQFVKLG